MESPKPEKINSALEKRHERIADLQKRNDLVLTRATELLRVVDSQIAEEISKNPEDQDYAALGDLERKRVELSHAVNELLEIDFTSAQEASRLFERWLDMEKRFDALDH